MTPGEGALGALEASGLAREMREALWLYPAVEIVHIVGLAILVGSIAMFDLRVLGVARSLPVRAVARFLLPWTIGSLVLIVPTGLAMFATHASDFIGNPAFITKMVLLLIAGTNAALFHVGVYQRAAMWDTVVRAPALAQLQAVVSLLLWVGVISCGRLIAYL
ncbi:MAG: hypothetical protein HC807_04120 [Gammaproteobacteria bacterium]|nr:hypothetical protein [Gammaproteobacteria bacterium]